MRIVGRNILKILAETYNNYKCPIKEIKKAFKKYYLYCRQAY